MDGKYQIGFWIVKYERDHGETKQIRNPQKIIKLMRKSIQVAKIKIQ